MVQRLKINQFYGAPTAIRLLLKYGDQWVHKYDRSTLKTLGSGMPNVMLGCVVIFTNALTIKGIFSEPFLQQVTQATTEFIKQIPMVSSVLCTGELLDKFLSSKHTHVLHT